MSIQLLSFHVSGLGPITHDISFNAGQFNLIYGPNETGKTFLVEFLLKSLFRDAANWNVREFLHQGQVICATSDGECIFSPASEKKLDDLPGISQPFPGSLSRLLVVRGADLAFNQQSSAGIDRRTLLSYLRHDEEMLNLQQQISRTIQETQIESGHLLGPQRGELKRRLQIQAEIDKCDRLFDQLDQHYSNAERAQLKQKIEQINAAMRQQTAAGCFQAYQIDEKLTGLHAEQEKLFPETLPVLLETIHEYQQLAAILQDLQGECARLADSKSQYNWLKAAIDTHERFLTSTGTNLKPALLAFSGFSLFLALIFTLVNYQPGAIISLLSGILTASAAIIHFRHGYQQAVQTSESERISHEFKQRFHTNSATLADLKAMLELVQEDYYRQRMLTEEEKKHTARLHELRTSIRKSFDLYGLSIRDETAWNAKAHHLKTRLDKTTHQIQQLQIQLQSLDVDPQEFIKINPGCEYDPSHQQTLITTASEFQNQLKQKEFELTSLKQRICQVTGDDISLDWDVLIEHLQASRMTCVQDYKSITAEILVKVTLHQILCKRMQAEDELIHTGLQNSGLLNTLHAITGRYQRIHVEDENVIVSDPFQSFNLSDLSTGAREQVLLAIRLGFSAAFLSNQPAFLLLDDAFQHADWVRRERLVNVLLETARSGWQIFYFTMDDHLRDMFLDLGSKHFGPAFCSLNL